MAHCNSNKITIFNQIFKTAMNKNVIDCGKVFHPFTNIIQTNFTSVGKSQYRFSFFFYYVLYIQ